MKIGDFVEIEFTGKLKEDNLVFDTTYEDVAKKNDIFDAKKKYGGIVIALGQKQIIPGLEEAILEKNVGDEFDVEIPPEKGFGKRDAKLFQLISMSMFKKQKINPYPGLQVNIDGAIGTIKSVSGGRVTVDLNHPFAGKTLEYHVKINKLIDKDIDKIKEFVSVQYGIPKETFKVEEGEKEIKLIFEFPMGEEKIIEELKKQIKQATGVKKEIVVAKNK